MEINRPYHSAMPTAEVLVPAPGGHTAVVGYAAQRMAVPTYRYTMYTPCKATGARYHFARLNPSPGFGANGGPSSAGGGGIGGDHQFHVQSADVRDPTNALTGAVSRLSGNHGTSEDVADAPPDPVADQHAFLAHALYHLAFSTDAILASVPFVTTNTGANTAPELDAYGRPLPATVLAPSCAANDGLNLDERAVLVAAVVSCDFDFSTGGGRGLTGSMGGRTGYMPVGYAGAPGW